MNTPHDIEHILESQRPALSPTSKKALWHSIERALNVPVPSPYRFSFVAVRPFAPLIIVAVLMVGAVGTARAAEAARPGDTLFVIDRAIEDLRLAIATDEGRESLSEDFAHERLTELREILSEETVVATENHDNSEGTQSGATIRPEGNERVGTAIEMTRHFIEHSAFDEETRETFYRELFDEIERFDSNHGKGSRRESEHEERQDQTFGENEERSGRGGEDSDSRSQGTGDDRVEEEDDLSTDTDGQEGGLRDDDDEERESNQGESTENNHEEDDEDSDDHSESDDDDGEDDENEDDEDKERDDDDDDKEDDSDDDD